jgi:hypothetical protein
VRVDHGPDLVGVPDPSAVVEEFLRRHQLSTVYGSHPTGPTRWVADGAVLALPGRVCDGLVKPLAASDLLYQSMLIVHGTRRFRDRVPGVPTGATDQSTTLLGCWYAALLRWRAAAAPFVNELTLTPVFVPPALARTRCDVFPLLSRRSWRPMTFLVISSTARLLRWVSYVSRQLPTAAL